MNLKAELDGVAIHGNKMSLSAGNIEALRRFYKANNTPQNPGRGYSMAYDAFIEHGWSPEDARCALALV